MSAEKRRSTAHVKPRRSSYHNGVGLRDVSQTVETYHNLLDRLYPVFAVWDIALYVARYCALCSVGIVGGCTLHPSVQVGELLTDSSHHTRP